MINIYELPYVLHVRPAPIQFSGTLSMSVDAAETNHFVNFTHAGPKFPWSFLSFAWEVNGRWFISARNHHIDKLIFK